MVVNNRIAVQGLSNINRAILFEAPQIWAKRQSNVNGFRITYMFRSGNKFTFAIAICSVILGGDRYGHHWNTKCDRMWY
uniref:Uncharacterized protein n=1 Tax=Anguilla anguilla TaxID=7936 RepID=A0A0E9XSU0_ANGAN